MAPAARLIATIYHQPENQADDEDYFETDAIEYDFFKGDLGFFLLIQENDVGRIVKTYDAMPSIEFLQQDAKEDWEK